MNKDKYESARFLWKLSDITITKSQDAVKNGGAGSGNHGHSGRPGKIGGSSKGGGGPDDSFLTLEDFEKSVRSNNTESFYAEDGAGDKILFKNGSKSHVEFSPEEMARMRTYNNISVSHNHPSSSSFSLDDLIFGSRVNAGELRVVTKDFDYTYTPSSTGWESEQNILVKYDYADTKAYNEVYPMYESKKLTLDQAFVLGSEKAMNYFASSTGGTFTKETPIED